MTSPPLQPQGDTSRNAQDLALAAEALSASASAQRSHSGAALPLLSPSPFLTPPRRVATPTLPSFRGAATRAATTASLRAPLAGPRPLPSARKPCPASLSVSSDDDSAFEEFVGLTRNFRSADAEAAAAAAPPSRETTPRPSPRRSPRPAPATPRPATGTPFRRPEEEQSENPRIRDYARNTRGAFWGVERSLATPAFKAFPQATLDGAKTAQYLRDWSPSDGDARIPLPDGSGAHLLRPAPLAASRPTTTTTMKEREAFRGFVLPPGPPPPPSKSAPPTDDKNTTRR